MTLSRFGESREEHSAPVTIVGQAKDMDTGGGEDWREGVFIAMPGAGGAVIGGTVANPFNVVMASAPTGAATSANQALQLVDSGEMKVSLASIDGKLPAALGQTAMAAALSVVIANNQSAIPMTVASLPLPANASTSALQTAGNGSLSSIDTKLPAALGPATMAASLSITFANNQTALPISAVTLPLPNGASTSAHQVTQNSSLSALEKMAKASSATDDPSDTGDSAAVAAATGLRFTGFSCKEEASGPAEFIIRHGDDAADPIITRVTLNSGESRSEGPSDSGIACPDGIFIDRVSGTTSVTIYHKAD